MGMTYRDSGVDVHAGQTFVQGIKAIAKSTFTANVRSGIGGFAALYNFPKDMENPVLVSGTDGVGTKLVLARQMESHQGIGQDLVAMCVNDIVTVGARSLFFLDYLATGKLDQATHLQVIEGIANACKKVGMPLIGGETAEHPDEMEPGKYDLAGFVVGVADGKRLLPRTDILPGDLLLGLPSSGAHSNGYSLIRKLISTHQLDLSRNYQGMSASLGETLLQPTRLYHLEILELHKRNLIKAAAHITGGGFYENIPRVLPAQTKAILDLKAIPVQPLFHFLAKQGPIEPREMFSTFNMGIGMVLVCAPEQLGNIQMVCPDVVHIGRMEKSNQPESGMEITGID